MKTKNLIIVLFICVVMLVYFLICNHLVNEIIENKTYDWTATYVQNKYPNTEWKYIKAIPIDKETFFVEIEIKNNLETKNELIKYNYNIFN